MRLIRSLAFAALVAIAAMAPDGTPAAAQPAPQAPATVQHGAWDAAANPAHIVIGQPGWAAEWGPMVQGVAHALILAAFSALGVWYTQHASNAAELAQDTDARARVIGAFQRAGNFSANAVDGVLKGQPVKLSKVPDMVTSMVQYVQSMDPAALKQLELGGVDLVKLAVAHLPGVEGEIPDSVIHGLAAKISAQSMPSDAAAFVAQLADLFKHNPAAAAAAGLVPPAPGPAQGAQA